MNIYKIYTINYINRYSYISDDFDDIEEEVIIKYVSSKEKALAFLEEIDKYNASCQHCINCPIYKLTKRKYNNRKSEVDSYCDNQRLVFKGNTVQCENEMFPDYEEYYIEEIEVE